MKIQCSHCGEEININISVDINSNQRITIPNGISIETGLAVNLIPEEGEAVLACIPPFKITALLTPEGTCVMKRFDQFFTASTIWRPGEAGEYQRIFLKLIEENKLMKVGLINDQLKVELSKDGTEWLEKMKKKEILKMNLNS